MKIEVIDNFLSSVYMDNIEQLITDGVLPLYLNVSTVFGISPIKGKESQQFIHNFVQEFQTRSGFISNIEPIIFNFMARTEVLKGKKLLRCKLNLNAKDVFYEENEFFPIHVDTKTNGITAIYYVNDADGDTFFFDNEYKIVKSVTPKKGRMVYFDNQILHAGQPPKESPFRTVINFNWV